MGRSSYDIDGLAIRCPSRTAVQNQARFYSGSKKKYCLNMQGVCDSHCRLISVTFSNSKNLADMFPGLCL